MTILVFLNSTPLFLFLVPGDGCVPGDSLCDSVPGGAFCSHETRTCQCYQTHVNTGTQCEQIGIHVH